MIISAPTGLYTTLLPDRPSDPTDIIYTISKDPPALTVNAIIVPQAVRRRKAREVVYTPTQRRKLVGELVLSHTATFCADPKDVARPYSIGQVLDFEASDVIEMPQSSKSDVVVRHNLNQIDSDKIGISGITSDAISVKAHLRYTAILGEIQSLQTQALQIENEIETSQKTKSDTRKVLNGLLALDDEEFTTTVQALEAKIVELDANVAVKLAMLTLIPTQIDDMKNKARTLAELVK